MSRIASGISDNVRELINAKFPPKFDLRSAFIAALAPAGMPEGDGGEGGEDDDDDDVEAGDQGGGTGGDGTGADDKGDVKDPEKKRLSDEAAANRVKAKNLQKELDAARAKIKEAEDKDKSELEKAQSDLKEAQAKADKLASNNAIISKRLAFYDSGAAALFKNPKTALKLLDVSDLEPDDDGEYDNDEVKKRAEALLKAEPYLAASEGDGKDDDTPASGDPNNKKKGDKAKNAEALAKKFPALRR